MKSMLISIALVLCLLSGTSQGAGDSWPDLSLPDNWASSGGIELEKKKSGEEVLDALMSRDLEECFGRRCLNTDQCCKGSSCVDVDGAKLVGTCLPNYGRSEGEACQQNADCSSGYQCMDTGNNDIPRSCQLEDRNMRKKLYNDECLTSAECDSSKGLCCQVQRRHRMAPRRVCYYFIDPKSCIGKLDTNVKPIHFVPNPFFKARLG